MTSINNQHALILACDFGTSGVTFGLYNPHTNKMEGFGGAIYQDRTNLADPQWVEQDPRDWINAIPPAMAQLRSKVSFDENDIVGIGIGGHMHALVLLDEHNQPVTVDDQLLCGAIMWNDPRGEPEGQFLSEKLGQPIPARMTLSRVRWFIENHPTQWQKQVHRVAVPSSYIALELTGEFGVGPGDASGMVGQLNDLGQIDKPGITALIPELHNRLPTVGRSGEVLGELNARGAELLGLPTGIPVAYPEGDQPVGMIASGCCRPGDASVSLGNSVVLNVVSTTPILGQRGPIDSFRTVTGNHLLMTCVTSGTIVYDQLVDLFKPLWPQDRTIDELRDWLAKEAAAVPPGCDGVAALPFYGGEGVLRQPNAFASWLGLRKGDLNAGVLARSSMEASSLMMRYGFECMNAEGLAEVSQLVLSGGGSKNTLWPQIVADIFKLPVVMPQDADEAATRGAAYLALHMLEQQTPHARSLEALLEERVTLSNAILPQPAYFDVYDEMLSVLIDTTTRLAPLYDHPRFIKPSN